MKINTSCIPTHVAIIMDGNGRWATRRGLLRNFGHKAGVDAVKRAIQACLKFNIKYCTFFAFSTENWKRSKDEVNGIFEIVRDHLKDNIDLMVKQGIKINSIGVLDPFPEDLRQALLEAKEKTKSFDKLTITFALNYGGRDDLTRAVNKIIKQGKSEITEKDISQNLDTAGLPDPDLVIRTSGEQRISNFMLYQMAYSELYFPKIYWPDFNEKQLKKAISAYQKRDRRFGGIK
ncbi:MAG: di-trans,poly-cis-decaprenylcistransferase [Clostridia bacterium]|nr:di-trans,poly-cis-decaprenylcistransferase [Clostridia bacterium]